MSKVFLDLTSVKIARARDVKSILTLYIIRYIRGYYQNPTCCSNSTVENNSNHPNFRAAPCFESQNIV